MQRRADIRSVNSKPVIQNTHSRPISIQLNGPPELNKGGYAGNNVR